MRLLRYITDLPHTLPRHFFGYLVCGGTAAVIDIGSFYLLTTIVGVYYLYANIIAYAFGMLTNFTLNKYVTFSNKSTRIPLQFFIFTCVAGIGLMLNQAILYVLVDHVHVKPLYAKVIAIILVLGWNFFGHRRFTFGPRMQNNYENT